MTGKPPIPFWLLAELKYWPPGRTDWARDYVELDHDLTPDEWIRLLRDLLDRVFDL